MNELEQARLIKRINGMVKNTLTEEVEVLQERIALTGPQGPQGRQGAAGERGPAGDTIVLDNRGEQGPQGRMGADGVDVAGASVVAEELIIEKSDGSKINVGNVLGPRGGAGKQGVQGKEGPIGPEGVTIINGYIKEDNLIIEKSDGEEIMLGHVVGPQGIQGDKGESVKGDPGPLGEQGPTGKKGPRGLEGLQGKTGIGLLGEDGPIGPQGIQGADGATPSIEKLVDQVNEFLTKADKRISGIAGRVAMSSGGHGSSGGSVNIRENDDVEFIEHGDIVDGQGFAWDALKQKFVVTEVGEDPNPILFDVGNVVGTLALDYADSKYQRMVVTGNITTMTVTGWAVTGRLSRLILYMDMGANYIIDWTWVDGWTSGDPPDLLSGRNELMFTSIDGGTKIIGHATAIGI